MRKHALILFAHGARDPEWALPFEKIRALVSSQRPDLVVELAYLELMTPRLAEVERRHPDVKMRLLPAVGEVDALLNAISAWLAASVPDAQ
jgi:sirohydrochlorin cobaltochelatase